MTIKCGIKLTTPKGTPLMALNLQCIEARCINLCHIHTSIFPYSATLPRIFVKFSARLPYFLKFFRLTIRVDNRIALNIVEVPNMSEQNAAHGVLTFFRLTRDDNGIAQNIVRVPKMSGNNAVIKMLTQNGAAVKHCI